MKKYIVVGIDSSPTSQNALRWALDEAAIRDCELHAVHAYEQSMIGAVPESGAVVFPRDLLEQYAVGMLDTAVDSVIGDRDEVTHIVRSATEGAPAKVLIEASLRAELLVVGQRGSGGFLGLHLGSVASKCVHHAHCPVVVVPTAADR